MIYLYYLLSVIAASDKNIIIHNAKQYETKIRNIINSNNNLSHAVKKIVKSFPHIKNCSIEKKHNQIHVNIIPMQVITKIEIDSNEDKMFASMIMKILKTHGIIPHSPYNEEKLSNAKKDIYNLVRSKGCFDLCLHSYIIPLKKNHSIVLGFKLNHPTNYRISKVYLTGNNKISKRQISMYLNTYAVPTMSRVPLIKYLFQTYKGTYDPKMISDDAQNIEKLYFRAGYVNAKVSPIIEVINSKLIITFNIEEGQKYTLGKVLSNPSRKNITSFAQILSTIEREKKLLDKHIEYKKYIRDDNVIDIEFIIQDHNISVISNIKIHGNLKLKESYIRKYLNIAEGDVIYQDKMQDIKNALESIDGILESSIVFDSESKTLFLDIYEDLAALNTTTKIETSSTHMLDLNEQNSIEEKNKNIFSNLGIELVHHDKNIGGKKISLLISGKRLISSYGLGLQYRYPDILKNQDLIIESMYKQTTLNDDGTLKKAMIGIYSDIYYPNDLKIQIGPKLQYYKLSSNRLWSSIGMSKYYAFDYGIPSASLALFLQPSKSFRTGNGTIINLSGSIESPMIFSISPDSKNSRYTILKETLSIYRSILKDSLFFKSQLTFSQIIEHGRHHAPVARKLDMMPHVFGFDMTNGYGPRDVQEDCLIGATKYLHLRNSISYPIESVSEIFGTDTSLFAALDLVWNNTPRKDLSAKDLYATTRQYKSGKIRTSISCGVHFSELPYLGEVNLGFSIPMSYYEKQEKNKFITDSGDKITNSLFTFGKSEI